MTEMPMLSMMVDDAIVIEEFNNNIVLQVPLKIDANNFIMVLMPTWDIYNPRFLWLGHNTESLKI